MEALTPHSTIAGNVRQQTDAHNPADYASYGLGKCGFMPSPGSSLKQDFQLQEIGHENKRFITFRIDAQHTGVRR